MKGVLSRRFYGLLLGLFIWGACSDPVGGAGGQDVTAPDAVLRDVDGADGADLSDTDEGEDVEGTDARDETADTDDTIEGDAPQAEVDPGDVSQGSCESEECRRQGRNCELLDGVPTCTDCLDGYVVNDAGVCIAEPVADCESLNCEEQNRACHIDLRDGASCGLCLHGFEEDGEGRCVPLPGCEELNCAAEHRGCVVDRWGEGACAGCLFGYFENDDGLCEAYPTCTELGCAEQKRNCNIEMGGGFSCGGCIFDHWESVDACVPATVCGADEYESAPLRNDADRECSPLTVCKYGEAESRAPTATTDRECTIVGRQPVPSVNVSIGYNALDWLNAEDLARTFAELKTLGVRMVRTDIKWNVIQAAGPDSWEWGNFDTIMHAAHAEGIQLFPIFLGTPGWAHLSDSGGTGPPNLAALENFAKQAAARYAPHGIHYWQAWNEPNMRSFLDPPDADNYSQMLTAIYTGVKAGNPDAFVVAAGLSPVPCTEALVPCTQPVPKPAFVEAQQFTRDYLANNPPMDAFAFHPYTFPFSPHDPIWYTGWNIMNHIEDNIRQIMLDYGYGDKDIWVSEHGAATLYVDESGELKGVTEAQQAEFTHDLITLCQGLSYCGPYFHYSFRDLWFFDPSNREKHFGILREDWSHKPAATTILSWAFAPPYVP